jgi:CrcB protein
MRLLILAMAGGAVGSGVRHLVNVGFGRWLGGGFPWWTLFENVSGSLLMGVLIELLALRWNGSPELRTLLATGVLGGYTTFSAFSLDFAVLLERHAYAAAASYLGSSVALAILGLFAGLWATRWLLT